MKKLYSLIFAFLVCLTCGIFLTACGGDSQVTLKQAEGSKNYITLYCSNGSQLGVTNKGEEQTITIEGSRAINYNTLKIYANSAEVNWTKNSNLLTPEDETWNFADSALAEVGTFKYTPQGDTEFTFAYEEYELEFDFALYKRVSVQDPQNPDGPYIQESVPCTYNELTQTQKNVLSSFRMGNQQGYSVAEILQDSTKNYKVKYSTIIANYNNSIGEGDEKATLMDTNKPGYYLTATGPAYGIYQISRWFTPLDKASVDTIVPLNNCVYRIPFTYMHDQTDSAAPTIPVKKVTSIQLFADELCPISYGIFNNVSSNANSALVKAVFKNVSTGEVVNYDEGVVNGEYLVNNSATRYKLELSVDRAKATSLNIELSNAKVKIGKKVVALTEFSSANPSTYALTIDNFYNLPINLTEILDINNNSMGINQYVISLYDVDMANADVLKVKGAGISGDVIYKDADYSYIEVASVPLDTSTNFNYVDISNNPMVIKLVKTPKSGESETIEFEIPNEKLLSSNGNVVNLNVIKVTTSAVTTYKVEESTYTPQSNEEIVYSFELTENAYSQEFVSGHINFRQIAPFIGEFEVIIIADYCVEDIK